MSALPPEAGRDAPPAGGLPHAGLDEIERVADLVLEFAAPWHG